jgi:pyrroline-5-carboxylate reductase
MKARKTGTKKRQKAKKVARRGGAAAQPAGGYDVCFVGGGNMATALIRGLVEAKICAPARLCAADIDARKRAALKRRYGIDTTADNVAMARRAKVVFLAVKPQIIDGVLEALRPAVSARRLFVSIAAGVSTERLERGLGERARVVRVMPNTPALLGKAISVLVRGRHASAADEKAATRLLGAVGDALAVRDERLLDPVTGLSGSGPAYVYRFAEALIAGGVEAGLSAEMARRLALQTIAGAAAMMLESGETPEQLRAAVTSPGGTTQAGLEEMARRGFAAAVVAGVVRASERSKELGAAS